MDQEYVAWEQFSDETTHYCYVRTIERENVYEVLRVTHTGNEYAEFLHQIFFIDEYDESEINEIVGAFDYIDLKAFIDANADISASHIYMLLASLMGEYADGRMMNAVRADELASHIIGLKERENKES